MNICMVGQGMMGTWHSENIQGADYRLHTLVGVLPEATAAFAEAHGYSRWTTDYAAALADPQIDVVIVATPSELHASHAIAALRHGKHVLVEIPIAMNLADAEQVVAAAEAHRRILGVCQPRRFGAERAALCRRIRDGEERVRLIDARFLIHRLSNVGATGLKRDWTDNLLWHHIMHLVDFGFWVLSGGDLANAERRIARLHTFMPPLDGLTGIPMEAVLIAETVDQQALVCTGSYYSRAPVYELLVVTDHDSYCFDERKATLTTGKGEIAVAPQQRECQMVALDFLAAVRENREPAVPGWSVLPAVRLLERAQTDWDSRYGPQALPGRPLPAAPRAA